MITPTMLACHDNQLFYLLNQHSLNTYETIIANMKIWEKKFKGVKM